MALLSPVATQIKMGGGIPATILTPPSSAATYDPTSMADFSPGTPSQIPVIGIYTDGRLAGLDVRFSGLFRFLATQLPLGLEAEQSSLVIFLRTSQISDVRERVFGGRLDGYDLLLAA